MAPCPQKNTRKIWYIFKVIGAGRHAGKLLGQEDYDSQSVFNFVMCAFLIMYCLSSKLWPNANVCGLHSRHARNTLSARCNVVAIAASFSMKRHAHSGCMVQISKTCFQYLPHSVTGNMSNKRNGYQLNGSCGAT